MNSPLPIKKSAEQEMNELLDQINLDVKSCFSKSDVDDMVIDAVTEWIRVKCDLKKETHE